MHPPNAYPRSGCEKELSGTRQVRGKVLGVYPFLNGCSVILEDSFLRDHVEDPRLIFWLLGS